jgi:hypothetical protein
MTSTARQLTLTIPVKDGELNPSYGQRQSMSGYLHGLNGKAVVVKLSRPVTRRSNQQNRYLWGCVYEVLSTETGHTAEEIHAILKHQFLPRKFITVGKHEHELTKSTTELTTDEFNLYLERCRAWASAELGIRIPLPNE